MYFHNFINLSCRPADSHLFTGQAQAYKNSAIVYAERKEILPMQDSIFSFSEIITCFRKGSGCYPTLLYPIRLFTWIRHLKSNRDIVHCLFSFFLTDLWLLAVIVFTLSGSQITTSASDPTAIRPFLGYRLKILAALVLVTATNWLSSILPVA